MGTAAQLKNIFRVSKGSKQNTGNASAVIEIPKKVQQTNYLDRQAGRAKQERQVEQAKCRQTNAASKESTQQK